MTSTLKLPVGIDDFRKLRESSFYYVDKTRLIEQLLLNWSEVTLFTRPRRFGKTLNMSMLKSFFEIGTDKSLFDGLYISGNKELCDEYMGKYPVIFLSFKGVEGLTYDEAFDALVRVIGKEISRVSFLADSDKLTMLEREQYKGLTIIEDGSFDEAVNEGVRRAYIDGYLRKSVVNDPVFDRINTKDNTPAIIHTKIVSGNQIKITAGGKGFGSENMSQIKMLTPSKGIEGVKQFILDTVFQAGPNPCPPMVVGVGIGGTFERAAQLAKKATFRPIDSKNEDERYAQLEDELLTEINKMGFGPAGLGGNTTAIGVNIETSPTHIAGMPVAVNICCHAARHASATI